jgi:hypothetical protein
VLIPYLVSSYGNLIKIKRREQRGTVFRLRQGIEGCSSPALLQQTRHHSNCNNNRKAITASLMLPPQAAWFSRLIIATD